MDRTETETVLYQLMELEWATRKPGQESAGIVAFDAALAAAEERLGGRREFLTWLVSNSYVARDLAREVEHLYARS
jgi:hypothetical protein